MDDVAFLCRYANQRYDDVMDMPISEFWALQRATARWLARENPDLDD